MKITNAQIYTLRRICSGEKHSLRGDGVKGLETLTRKTNKSLPKLFKLGLICFLSEEEKDNSKYYSVSLTELGKEWVSVLKIN